MAETAQILPFDKGKPKPSFADLLKQSTVKDGGTKKKTTVPTMDIDQDAKAQVDKWTAASTTWKQAAAIMAACAEYLIPLAREHQDREARGGRYSKSFKLFGEQSSIKITWKNVFSINAQDAPELKALLGAHYPKMIQEKPVVTLKAEVLGDQEKTDFLAEVLGERFTEFFEVKQTLSVAEDVDRDIYGILEPEELEIFRTLAKQYKPAIT